MWNKTELLCYFGVINRGRLGRRGERFFPTKKTTSFKMAVKIIDDRGIESLRVIHYRRQTISQKLILAQDIWNSIIRESSRLPMPLWQKKLEKRYSLYEQREMGGHLHFGC